MRLFGSIAAIAACGLIAIGNSHSRAAASISAPGQLHSHTSPLHDPRGLHPGLSPVPRSQRAAAQATIADVATAPAGSHTGYDRTADFGAAWTDENTATWGHDKCRTRDEILHRDLSAAVLRSGGCVVEQGTLSDPYTGQTIAFTKSRPLAVQIDHVMPLAYDWAHGARAWTKAKRTALANDPLNLLAVQGAVNDQKSDKGPSEFLPPRRAIDCAYAVRFAQVALKYALTVEAADKTAMQTACG